MSEPPALSEFAERVAHMRRAQSRYFRNQSRTHLREAKYAEAEVDNLVKLILRPLLPGMDNQENSRKILRP